MSRIRNTSRLSRTALAGVAAAGLLAAQSGCSNAGQGAVSGAALGALGGLGIGSVFGEAGKGAAVGAITGGIGGAVLGDQNQRRDRRYYRDTDY
jgi:hypothetical protein